MRILHFCSYYIGSKVYKNLFEHLAFSQKKTTQNVFIPVRNPNHIQVNQTAADEISLYYVKCLSIVTRLSFFFKQIKLILSLRCYLKRVPDLLLVDFVHAHTLYSDGFLALYMFKKYNIPYVVSVRTTDVSLFERYAPHWRFLTSRVIKNAKCVVFISNAHKILMKNRYEQYLSKTVVIPNGVDQFWIENSSLVKDTETKSGKSALYVGQINKNKNIKNSITAFLNVRKGVDDKFYVVGGNYSEFEAVYGPLEEDLLKRTCFVESTDAKRLLQDYLKNSDVLIMPSYMETFGLVYLEAISQCTPVVFSSDRGIDGLFENGTVGYACDPSDLESIKSAVRKTLERFPTGLDFKPFGRNPVEDFSWDAVTSRYLNEVY